jgi:hypothetical protein
MGPTLTYANHGSPQSNLDASSHMQRRSLNTWTATPTHRSISYTLCLARRCCHTVVRCAHPSRSPLFPQCAPLNERGRRAATSSQCRHLLATAALRRPLNPRLRHREHCIREAQAHTRKLARAAPADKASPRDTTRAQRMARMEGNHGAWALFTQPTQSASRTLHAAASAYAGLGGSCWTRAFPVVRERVMLHTTHAVKTPRASVARDISRSRTAMDSKTTPDEPRRLKHCQLLQPMFECRTTTDFVWASCEKMRAQPILPHMRNSRLSTPTSSYTWLSI